jgi:hypothetical protein
VAGNGQKDFHEVRPTPATCFYFQRPISSPCIPHSAFLLPTICFEPPNSVTGFYCVS